MKVPITDIDTDGNNGQSAKRTDDDFLLGKAKMHIFYLVSASHQLSVTHHNLSSGFPRSHRESHRYSQHFLRLLLASPHIQRLRRQA